MAIARAGVVVLFALIPLSVVFHCIATKPPATYMVGDGLGWSPTIDMQSWARDKKFFAGDILVFRYDYQLYDVVVDDKEGFNSCSVSDNSKTYESGNDRIQLAFGNNYFICSNPDDCQAGMKMVINATARPPL